MRFTQSSIPRTIFSLFILVFLACGWAWPHSTSATPIQELKQGVVKITSTLGGKQRIGTGIIIKLDPDAAYIVTASHVIEGDQHPKVSFFSKPNRPVSAKVIGLEGGDPRGLGALLVEGTLPSGLSALPLNPSLHVAGGENVTIIGFPGVAGTSWAVTPGTIAGSSGRDLSFTAPADEGNSGGPLLMKGQVVGIITEVAGSFAHATPAIIAKFALESWGVKFPLPATQDGSSPLATPPFHEKMEEPVVASTPSPVLDLTGTWRNVANPAISYSLDQEGSQVTMEEFTVNMFGPVMTASGEGRLQGKTLTLTYITAFQTGGKSLMTLSEDGQTMSGTFTDLVSGVTLPLSLVRQPDEETSQNEFSQFDLFKQLQ
jgi:Trypsin-like peptidase domain